MLPLFCVTTGISHRVQLAILVKFSNAELNAKRFYNHLKGLLHCFSTCIEITGNNWYCFILKNVENCKENFLRVKKL